MRFFYNVAPFEVHFVVQSIDCIIQMNGKDLL